MSSKRAIPSYQPKFKEWRPKPHMRQADIDAQPRPITMGGIGNGQERQYGGGRGT